MKRAFTLIEMVIVIAIIGILVAMAASVYVTALSQSKAHRTRAMIAKIDTIIGEKWESYRTRQVPIRIPGITGFDRAPGRVGVDDDGNGTVDDSTEIGWPGSDDGMMPAIGEPYNETPADNNLTNGFYDPSESYTDRNGNGRYDIGTAEYRLLAMRELQRMELPNLKLDVSTDPVFLNGFPVISRPSISKQYLRRAIQQTGPTLAGWTPQYEGAECLYLILSATRDGDKSALDYFSASETGDFDNDGMEEVIDSFGQPVEFVRWPAGYRSDIAPFPVTPQDANTLDQFDPFKVDGRTRSNIFATIALKPLVYSAGPDRQYKIGSPAAATFLANPYRVDFVGSPPGLMAGSPYDASGNQGWTDNITSHDLEAR